MATPPPTIDPTQNNFAVVAAAPDKDAMAVPVEAVPKLKSPIIPPAVPKAPSFPASRDVSLFCTFGEGWVMEAAMALSVFAVFNLSSANVGIYIIPS